MAATTTPSAAPLPPTPTPTNPLRVLVFSKTRGYRHACIPAAVSALQRLAASSLRKEEEGQQQGVPAPSPVPLAVTATESDEALASADALAPYSVLVLLQNSGVFLSAPQLDALRAFVRRGGGVVGVHCATAGMPSAPRREEAGGAGEEEGATNPDPERWYARLLGAEFADHPVPQRGIVRVVDAEHPIVKGTVGKGRGTWRREGGGDGAAWLWEWFDEWYNYREDPRSLAPGAHVLLAADESSYEGGRHGADHPLAWCHEFEGGRSFYTALGHFDEAYEDEAYMGQLVNGILWAARLV